MAVVESQNVDSQGCLHKGVSPIFCQQVEITLYVYCIKKRERKRTTTTKKSGEQGFVKVGFGDRELIP